MKVEELVEELYYYNPNAEIQVVVNGTPKEFEICFGSSDGVNKWNCEDVSFMVETENERS